MAFAWCFRVHNGAVVLVDAMVIIDAARTGRLDVLLREHRIGMAESVFEMVKNWRDTSDVAQVLDVETLVAEGELCCLCATVGELVAVLIRLQNRTLGLGDLETLAIANSRRLPIYTHEVLVGEALDVLGAGELWCRELVGHRLDASGMA